MKLHSTFTILLFSAITTALPQTPETAPPQDKSKELFFQTFFNRRGGVFRDPKYHRISTASLNETHMLEISLDWFAENLKSYVYPSYFDFASFDKDSRILAQDIRAIGNLRETRGPFNVEILKSYSFIDNMFSEMLYAS
ncbi:hypothetical protein JCM33374_g2229 [Metschnikowia sp. JCM 33374]|nr:hypothetical protein JCM33374_g2229 [Metschnikowia sp. JCM 33374]